MHQKPQILGQSSPKEGVQATVPSQKAHKQELGLEEEKEGPNLPSGMIKKNTTSQLSGHSITNEFLSQGLFNREPELGEPSYFEKIFKDEKLKGENQTYDAFGFPISDSSTKQNLGTNLHALAFKSPFIEENKVEIPTIQFDKQYPYLNSFFPGTESANPAEFRLNQAETKQFFHLPERDVSNQTEIAKSLKSASEEKIIRKVMGKVAGPRNLQLSSQGFNSQHDRRPATTRPAFRHVWNYQSTSKLKPYESLVGPDEEEEDAENDDEEDSPNMHNRRNTATNFTKNNPKQIIEAVPKILPKNPFILNVQDHDVYVDGSDKHDDFESEGSTAKSFSGNPNNRSSIHHTSGEVWEGGTPITTTPRLSQGFIGYHGDPNINFITQQVQEGMIELQKSGYSGGYDNARRTSNQLSNDSMNRSYDGWNLKNTPSKTNNQLIKKSSLSFISSESTIDSDNFNNNFEQINNSFNTHFSANSSNFQIGSKQKEMNSGSKLELSNSKRPSKDIQLSEFPKMNYSQQQLMGFNNQMNPSFPTQMMPDQRMQQVQFEQMQQPSFEQLQQQKFECSQQQQFERSQQQQFERSQQQQFERSQQQQAMYQTSKRGGYNLNQSAILFGNTTGAPMNPQMMQGNWHMQNQQMDQLNRSFNMMNLHTTREGMMYSSQQSFNLNQSMTLPTRSNFQDQSYPNTQRNDQQQQQQQQQKQKNIGSHQKIKGKGSKKGADSEDSSKEFEIDLRTVEQVPKTTLMIRNIPNKYDQNLLLQAINKSHKGKFDFLYLPIDFKNKCNVGYAFINFIKNTDIRAFYMEFNGKKWDKFNSEKIAQINYARIQGLKQLVHHFKSSNVMNQQDKKLKPVVLSTSTRQSGTEMIQNIQSIEELIKQQKATLNKTSH